jgi:hypothetical protein
MQNLFEYEYEKGAFSIVALLDIYNNTPSEVLPSAAYVAWP